MSQENSDSEKYAPGCIPERQRDRNVKQRFESTDNKKGSNLGPI